MITTISWSIYAETILITLVVYYIIVAILYYRNEISSFPFRIKEQQNINLSHDYPKEIEDAESVDTFFQNQIKDNQHHEFENSSRYQPDFEKFDSSEVTDKAVVTNSPFLHQPELSDSHQNYTPSIIKTDNTLQQVQELTNALKEAITLAVDENCGKEEFILSLQLLLKNILL